MRSNKRIAFFIWKQTNKDNSQEISREEKRTEKCKRRGNEFLELRSSLIIPNISKYVEKWN